MPACDFRAWVRLKLFYMDPLTIAAIVGSGSNLIGNGMNVLMQHMQNKHNEKMVRMQNAAAAAESDKAYERSKPTTQVTNMRQVGMSQAGAVNALNGGGSYAPAPVNVSQGEAPQIDVSGLTNVLMASEQLKEQKRQFNENLGLEKEKLQLEKDKFQESANQNAALRNIWQDESEFKKAQTRQINIRNDIDEALKEGTISAGRAENLAKLAQAQLQEIEAQKKKIGYEQLSPTQIKIISEYQASLEVMSQFGSMTAQKIIEYLHNIVDSLPFL